MDDRASPASRLEHLLVGQPAGVVHTVGEHQHQRPGAGGMVGRERELHGVAEPRPAVSGDRRERAANGREVFGDRRERTKPVRKGQQARPFARPQRRHQPIGRRNQVRQPVAQHAAAGVEHQLHAERQLIDVDAVDDLLNAVVGDDEVGGGQPPDGDAIPDDRDVEPHDIDAAPERRHLVRPLRMREGRGGDQETRAELKLHGRCACAKPVEQVGAGRAQGVIAPGSPSSSSSILSEISPASERTRRARRGPQRSVSAQRSKTGTATPRAPFVGAHRFSRAPGPFVQRAQDAVREVRQVGVSRRPRGDQLELLPRVVQESLRVSTQPIRNRASKNSGFLELIPQ